MIMLTSHNFKLWQNIGSMATQTRHYQGIPEQNKKILPPFVPPLNVGFIVSKTPRVFKTWGLFSGKIPTFDTHVLETWVFVGNPRSTRSICGFLNISVPTIDISGYDMNKK